MSALAVSYDDDLRARTEQRRAETFKREASLAKTGRPIVYTIGDDTVTLIKQPMEWGYTYQDGTHGEPKFKSKYKVEMNGVHRGWLVARNGWGAGWTLHRVTDKDDLLYWRIAKGDTGYSTAVLDMEPARQASSADVTRARFANMVPELVASGKLGTLDEQQAQARERAERKAQEEAESAAMHVRWKAERIAENRKAIEGLRDREATLRAILDRQVLTNYESEVVSQLIAETAHKICERNARLKKDGE